MERAVRIAAPEGLHARPASVFVSLAKSLDSTVTVHHKGRSAPADSILMVLALGASRGAEVVLEADGPDAADAIDKLARVLMDESPSRVN